MSEKEHKTRILFTEFVTHDVKSFIAEKPEDYRYQPGQATLVSLCEEGWEEESRPFTFTSLVDDPVLQFTVKEYPERSGVTSEMHTLSSGDEVVIREPWGTILYQGPGTFLAAGAGVTPFLAILRDLKENNEIDGNQLIFSNKAHKDIIREKELKDIFANRPNGLLLSLTRETSPGYHEGRIDRDLLSKKVKDIKQNFYICGPPAFVDSMQETLVDLGADGDSIVVEE